MKSEIDVLIIGGGMYVSGKGTTSDGTIIPSLLEARRHNYIKRLGLVTTSADSSKENRERINNLAQRMGVDSQCEYFPKSGKTNRLFWKQQNNLIRMLLLFQYRIIFMPLFQFL